MDDVKRQIEEHDHDDDGHDHDHAGHDHSEHPQRRTR
jgi:hypothetical protein